MKKDKKIIVALMSVAVLAVALSGCYFGILLPQKEKAVISKELQDCVDKVDYTYDIENKKLDVYITEKYKITSDYEPMPAGAAKESVDSSIVSIERWTAGLKDCFKKYPSK